MEGHMLIAEADVSAAVQAALEEIETGSYNATQQGVEVLLDGKIDFKFVVIRSGGENAVDLNSTTSNPEIISSGTDTYPEIVSTTLREEPEERTTVTDANPEDQTVTLDSSPEIISESHETHPTRIDIDETVDSGHSTSGSRSIVTSQTVSNKTGGDNSLVQREYDEFP